MKIKKISHKIVIFNTISILLCTLVVAIVSSIFFINEYVDEENEELNNISNGVISILKTVPYENINNFYENLEFGDKGEIMVLVTYPNGKSILLGKNIASYNDIPESKWILKKDYALHFLEKNTNNIKFTFIRKYTYDRIIKTSEILLYFFLLLATLIIIISYIMTKHILKPVTYVIQESEKMNEKNLNIRLPKIRDDEIGDLIDVINNLFSKMDKIVKNQKNFSSNISHELKTPIAIMKGYIDILKWGRDDPKLLNEALNNIEIEIKNIEKLVSNLFFISQAEKLKILNEKIDLNMLLKKLKSDYELLNINKKIQLDSIENTFIYGDYQLIFEVFRGLVDNSVKYSTGDSIIISAEKADDIIKVIIRDFGSGIPDELHEKIFDRFYQVDSKSPKGLGLGLTIIKEIISLHNADIKLVSRVDGLDVELYFKI